MRVNEIFYSLSGEGVRVGTPTIFVRLQGCNLNCSYCDTQYARNPSSGEELTAHMIWVRINLTLGLSRSYPLLITGGEPLLQADSVSDLVKLSGFVEIETNGNIDPPKWFSLVDAWSVDVKCPSSGSSYGTFRPKWLERLRKRDQLKFVVTNEDDIAFVGGFLHDLRLRCCILVSPAMPNNDVLCSREWLQRVAEFCKEQNVRMSIQLHKILWGNQKGV